jgi:hypothetical protein
MPLPTINSRNWCQVYWRPRSGSCTTASALSRAREDRHEAAFANGWDVALTVVVYQHECGSITPIKLTLELSYDVGPLALEPLVQMWPFLTTASHCISLICGHVLMDAQFTAAPLLRCLAAMQGVANVEFEPHLLQ